jgi:hypothetical protein
MNPRRDRVGWIIVGVLLLALLVVGLLWAFGVFARPQVPILPTPTIMPTPTTLVSPTVVPTNTPSPTRTPTVQATPIPPSAGGPQGTVIVPSTVAPRRTAVPGVGVATVTPAPPFRPGGPLEVATPTETPIVLDGGVEAGFPP